MRWLSRAVSIVALGGFLALTACSRDRLPTATGQNSTADAFAPAELSQTVAFPLTLSPNKRYLIDQNGAPFLIAGESPQALMVQLSPAQAEMFFANRESHGFNAVWINLLCRQSFTGRTNGSTYDGIVPFTTPNDLSTPNEAYFARCDQMISLAAAHHMLVILDPIETIDHLTVMVNNGPAKCREFGRYLGNRYKNFDNILWMSGNDYQTWPTQDYVVTEVARGIQETDTRHIHTVELDYFVSGSLDDAANWQSLIQLNASYTYYPTYIQVLTDYNRATGLMPVFMVEATYEFEHNANAGTLRRQEYWSILSGATGQLYGSGYTWGFIPGWENTLNSPGATQMAYVQNLFLSRPWYQLVPDQDHTFVTAGYGTYAYNTLFDMNSNYVTAAVTPDGNLGMAYLPSSRTVTVNMARLSGGQAKAWWYNPVNGSASLIGTYPTSGSRDFTPTAAGDWVLVLDNATLNLGAPGSSAPPSNPPTVVNPAAATPNPTSGTTTGVSALGADDGGEANLTYNWVATGTPPGPVTFTPTGTNAAKNSTATFSKAGSYTLQVSISDASGQTVTSSVNVSVNQTYTGVAVVPASATVAINGTQQFTATARDQFGQAMTTQPSFTWGVTEGGTISAFGLFTAGSAPGGPFAVTATGGSHSGTANVTITAGGPITMGETSVLSIDDSGNGNLLIAQATSLSQPAVVQSLSFYVTTATGKLRLGVYDATGPSGGPGAKKAETAEITPVVGWNTAVVTTPVNLAAGNYWLAYLPDHNGLHFRRSGSGTCKFYSYSYGPMPATFGTTPTTIADHWSFYATLGTGGGGNAAPTVAQSAAANPNPVTGTTTNLSVLGADDGGEPALIYTWSAVGAPPAPVTFSINGTNAARNTVASFGQAGSYTLQATIQDQGGLTETSNLTVTVNQTLTSIVVSPASASVPVGGTQPFNATARDQFGIAMATQPSFTWSVAGGGTINSGGLFTAGNVAGGPYAVTAAASGRTGTGSVTVTGGTNAPPTIVNAAAANPNPVVGTTTTLSALGADDGGESALTYTWRPLGTPPAPVSFSPNGTNAAKNTTATFSKAGSYHLRVTIRDQGGLTAISNLYVTVNQTTTSITVSPASASVPVGGAQPFSAAAVDQFGHAMAAQPPFAWSVSGGGTISAGGLFTAGGAAGGPFTVTAAAGGRTGTASITVTGATSIRIGETNVLSIDDSGNGNLLIAQATALGQTATVQSLSFYVATASGKLRLGIYDATGPSGGPGVKLAETAEITPETGWNTAIVTAPVSLAPGAYWLAYLPSSNGLHFRRAGSGSCRYRSYAYGTMPATFGASTTNISDRWSFYGTLTP